jgi:hypothetical protein
LYKPVAYTYCISYTLKVSSCAAATAQVLEQEVSQHSQYDNAQATDAAAAAATFATSGTAPASKQST